MNQINENTLLKVKVILLTLLSLFVIFYTYNTYKEGKLIGANATNTITVNGKAEIDVKPDMATINFTIRESGKDAKGAEALVSNKSSKVLELLKKLVDEKDIKTGSYASYPKYSYPANSVAKIDGYETTQILEVKVRDIAKVSDVIQSITSSGINEISGPNYVLDNDEDYKNIARGEAINDAKKKAELLAKQLGVELVRIVSFSEDSYSPMPYYSTMSMRADSAKLESAPSLPTGENTTTSNVTITYEIK